MSISSDIEFSAINFTHPLSDMSLESTQGAYAGLGIKVMSYLMLLQISILERRTFHQGQLQLTGQRQMLLEIRAHFHELNLKEP